jgi:hypothetical protein
VVVDYRRGGEEEVVSVEVGERWRRPSGVRSRAEEVAGGAQRRAARPSLMLGHREPKVGDEAGGSDRAGLGCAGRVATRSKGFFG